MTALSTHSPGDSFAAHALDSRVAVYKSMAAFGRDFWESDFLAAEIHDPEIVRLSDLTQFTREDMRGLGRVRIDTWREGGQMRTMPSNEDGVDQTVLEQVMALCALAAAVQAAVGLEDGEFHFSGTGVNLDWHYDILPTPTLNLVIPLRMPGAPPIQGTHWAIGDLTRDQLAQLRNNNETGIQIGVADPTALFILKNGVDDNEVFEDPRGDCLFHRASIHRSLTLLGN